MVLGARAGDLLTLGRSALLSNLSPQDLSALLEYLDVVEVAAGTRLADERAAGDRLGVVLEGQAVVQRGGVVLRQLASGDYFGGLALAHVTRGSVTVDASSSMRVAMLERRRYEALAAARPGLALHLVQALVQVLAGEFNAMTDHVSAFLHERTLPRRPTISVRVGNGTPQTVATGTKARALVRSAVEPAPGAVGVLLGGRVTSLETPLTADAHLVPVTLASEEGRDIYRRSAGIMVLEALGRVAPSLRPLAGPAIRGALLVRLALSEGDRADLAERVSTELENLRAAAAPFREEMWRTDEAALLFSDRGWTAAAKLLRTARADTQVLASCGVVYALAGGPVMTTTAEVYSLRALPHPEGLLIDLGGVCRSQSGHLRELESRAFEEERRRYRYGGSMAEAHRAWLDAMGIETIGDFNAACVAGRVQDLVLASEGFHEKEIGVLADAIAARAGEIRIICVAGPSSSGKTTFLRRLKVQLQVNRIRPVALSLDDYYVDREETPRTATGEYDFEAWAALRIELFHEHVSRLLRGERVQTARYDFLSGKSMPDGGPEVQLGTRDVVLVEGIHGLNPEVVAPALDLAGMSGARRSTVFNVFVHAATALALDANRTITPEDIRLVRRLVRDRHGRGYAAAETLARWPAVLRGESEHIYPFLSRADFVFDTSLAYELAVLKVYAERYLLEVPGGHVTAAAAARLRELLDTLVPLDAERVPPNSLLREFISGGRA
jgi:uridine kinase